MTLTIKTKRLVLRPLVLGDIERMHLLLNDPDVIKTTLGMPYPNTITHAKNWVEYEIAAYEQGNKVILAIELRETGETIGSINLDIDRKNEMAELGYWIGTKYWNKGYATEASQAMIKYGFEHLKLHRIHANHSKENIISGRVLRKIGMEYEGCQKHHVKKDDVFKDLENYGILAEDYFKTT